MATLTAYWPDGLVQNPNARTSTIGWDIRTDDGLYDDILNVTTLVFTTGNTAVGATVGDVTFDITVDGSDKGTHHWWKTLSNADTYPKYIGHDAYLNNLRGIVTTLPRKLNSYTVTVTVTYEVGTRLSGGVVRKFTDGRQTDSTTYTLTVPALPRYTVSYNANGGTGAPSSQTKQYDVSLTLSSTRPTRNNYSFNSWNDSSSGSGTSYAPSASYTSNYDVTLYAIWDPIISFNGNGGGNVPSSFIKVFNSAASVPSTVPTKDGYTFVEWNTNSNGTGTSYAPSDTIDASMNDSMTLYAIWAKVTAPPTISSITVIRCNSSGTQSDMGAYAKMTVTWSVDRTYDSSNTGYVTGKYRESGTSGYTSFSFTSGTTSGTGGTATAIVSGMDTDKQYEFVATVHDSCDEVGHTDTTTRSVILTRAKFIMDLKAGGEAMGLFSAAPSEGLEVGKKTQIDDTLTVLGNVIATNLTLTSESDSSVASASGTFSVSSPVGYKYGPFRMVAMSFSSSTALTAETLYTLGALTSAYSTPKAIGFANQYGTGYVSGTTIYFKPLVSVSASTSLYVALTYIKP